VQRAPDTANLGFLLAKASQRWNELLAEGFAEEGFPEVRPSYGSVLIPLLEEDGLRMGEIARRSRLTKQTITTLVRLCERDGLVEREPDPEDGRATIVSLTPHARRFEPAAERVLGGLESDVARLVGPRQRATLGSTLADLAELDR
jgi:MarR family transcriptional regulator, organic hydroperoxide resistance regulator